MKTLAGNDAVRAGAAGDLLQPGMLVLVIGGAASGKSAFAEGLAVRMHALSAGKEAGESEKAAAGAVVPAGADSVREDPAAGKGRETAAAEDVFSVTEAGSFLHGEGRQGKSSAGRSCCPGNLWYAATMHSDPADAETAARIEKHRAQRAGKGFGTIEIEREIGRLAESVKPGDTILLEDLSNLLANELFPWEGAPVPAEEVYARIVQPILALHARGIGCVVVGNRISEDLHAEYDAGTRIFCESFQMLQREFGAAADAVVEVVCGIPVWHR